MNVVFLNIYDIICYGAVQSLTIYILYIKTPRHCTDLLYRVASICLLWWNSHALLTVFVCQTRTMYELFVPVSHADFYICGEFYYTHSVIILFRKKNCENLSVVTPNGPKQKL